MTSLVSGKDGWRGRPGGQAGNVVRLARSAGLSAFPLSQQGAKYGAHPNLASAPRATACAPAVSMLTGSAPKPPPLRASNTTVTNTLR